MKNHSIYHHTDTPINRPQVIIMAGPNGAGKSTTALALLSVAAPDMLHYINPDLIARGLAPRQPEAVAFAAGRIVHNRIRELMKQKVDFSFETTLSGRAYAKLLPELKAHGFEIRLLFLWVKNSNLLVERVAERVREGGHNIPESDIRKRHETAMRNFFTIYCPIVEEWQILDNSNLNSTEVIAKNTGRGLQFYKPEVWNQISRKYEKKA